MDYAAYTSGEHAHRFAVWTAARAAMRACKGFSIEYCRTALDGSGVRKAVDQNLPYLDQEQFDDAHEKWCTAFEKFDPTVCTPSYGRAAKAINIYMKTRLLNVSETQCPALSFVHPPLDKILFMSMHRCRFGGYADWKNFAWTLFEKNDYITIINRIKAATFPQPLWKIEHLWP